MKANNKLVNRFFFIILLSTSVIFIVVYLFTVPLIKKEIFEIEKNSAHLALNNVFELADTIYVNLELYREQYLSSQKRKLNTVIELTAQQIKQVTKEEKIKNNIETRQNFIRNLKTNKSDFVKNMWIVDFQNTFLLFHKNPANTDREIHDPFHETNIQELLIDKAFENGEFYYEYKKFDGTKKNHDPRLAYAKYYSDLEIVIGTEISLSGFDQELNSKRQQAIEEFRKALTNIRIAKTGYLFIFDKNGNMLYHPNKNIDKTNAGKLKNPETNNYIINELSAIADTGKELYYKWDKPSDPGNYIYPKLALVRLLEGFDWYISSSVYIDELYSSADALSNRILLVAFFSITISLIAAIFFTNRIFQPIKQLVNTAEKINKGDLTAKSGIQSKDEIGVLADTFDKMVDNLRENIEDLDNKVKCSIEEISAIEERQRLILDALPAQVAYLDKNLIYIFVNKGYADFFKLDKKEVIGRHLSQVIGTKMVSEIHEEINLCLQGKEVTYEYHSSHDNKELVTKRMLLPDFDSSNNLIGVLNLSLDITAEKEAERRITEAHRINVAGQLAGGLAHDFNNLLSIILGNLQIIRDRKLNYQDMLKYIDPAIKASLRSADITERLLSFSRHQNLTPNFIEVLDIIDDAINLIKNAIPEKITIQTNISCQKVIYVDQSQMENVLVNLILNAVDAIGNTGKIHLTVKDVIIKDHLQYDEPVTPGDYIKITIKDTGSGFSEESLTKAFEPFYTTKPRGKGTGLGLSMVYGFIKQSKGYINIESKANMGSIITLLLPAYQNDNVVDITEKNDKITIEAEKDNRLFLLVEDNSDIRKLIREQLVDTGCYVIEAENGEEAVSLIENLPNLDGMISDISMPGAVSGFDLADIVSKKYHYCTIVLITGYYSQAELGQHSQWKILRKPFDKDTLVSAIRINQH